jgi:integrase/recombinase XerC
MTPGCSPTLAEAFAVYQAEFFSARNLSARTRGEYTADLTDLLAYLNTQSGITQTNQLTQRQLEGYLTELDRRGLKGSSRRRKVASIRSFCTFLVQRGYLAHNPAAELIPPQREYYQPRVLTETEYKRLLEAVRHETRDAAMIEVLLQTGMRLSELSRLTISDVTLPGKITKDDVGSVHIRGKGRRERLVTLNAKACKAIKSYLAIRPQAETPALFLTKFGKGIGPRAIEQMVEKYLREATIENASVHSLRHTFATQHVKKGTSLKVVQDMLGHQSLATTSLYVSLARELMDKEIQQNAL